MKRISIIGIAVLFSLAAQATTYTIGSGKWNNRAIWGETYIGTTIKAGDVVIIKGHITLTIPLFVEGVLQIEKGAALIGMSDLTIAQSGRLINNGNTVVRKIVNAGAISNNSVMEAMNNIDNTSVIENNHNMLAGNNFSSTGGNAFGRGGRIYANNAASVSADTELEPGVNVYAMRKKE